MTRATFGYGPRPTQINLLTNKFMSYKSGPDRIVIEPHGKFNTENEKPPMKEIVAKETEDLIGKRQRLSVRELALKFEKGLSTATWLSDEVKWGQVALLEREVLLKKLREVLESLKYRVGGKNKDEVQASISMVETLTVQLSQREGELLQQKEQVKTLATSLKRSSEDAKRIVEEERNKARTEIEYAREAVSRVYEAFNEHKKLSRTIDNQDVEGLRIEVQEARRIKMLHNPSKVMDMEFEIQILQNQLAGKSKESIQLRKQLDLHKRSNENKMFSFELEGLECLGSSLHIVCQNIDISNCSIQWYRIQGNKREAISGATKLVYAPDPYDVSRHLEAEISHNGKISSVSTMGPIDHAPGLVGCVEALVRKRETQFNVVLIKMNGNDHSSDSIHALNIGRLRIKLSRGKFVLAKEFYSSNMQVCGVRGGGDAACHSLYWGVRTGLSFVLAFESSRERNSAIMLARRFAVDCNVMLVGPGDPIPGWNK